jgi:hypothetical protein
LWQLSEEGWDVLGLNFNGMVPISENLPSGLDVLEVFLKTRQWVILL